MNPQPFPFQDLPKVAQRDRHLARLARALVPAAGVGGGRIALSRLLDARIGWRWGTPSRRTFRPAAEIGFELACTSGGSDARLTCPAGVAAAIAERALGGPWPPPHMAPAPLDALTTGALGYVVARALAALGSPYLLRAPLDPTGREVARMLHLPAHLEVDGLALPVSAWLPESALADLPATEQDLRFAADMPMVVSACAGESRLRLSDIADLACGDVVICDWCSVEPAAMGPRGSARLRCGTHVLSGLSLRCEAGNMEVVMSDEPKTTTRVTTGDHIPADTHLTDRALSLAGDAPITLQLELARFNLTLKALAELQPGDVLSTGSPIGAPVTLLAGERAIARGELVDLDGELGVRVTALGQAR